MKSPGDFDPARMNAELDSMGSFDLVNIQREAQADEEARQIGKEVKGRMLITEMIGNQLQTLRTKIGDGSLTDTMLASEASNSLFTELRLIRPGILKGNRQNEPDSIVLMNLALGLQKLSKNRPHATVSDYIKVLEEHKGKNQEKLGDAVEQLSSYSEEEGLSALEE